MKIVFIIPVFAASSIISTSFAAVVEEPVLRKSHTAIQSSEITNEAISAALFDAGGRTGASLSFGKILKLVEPMDSELKAALISFLATCDKLSLSRFDRSLRSKKEISPEMRAELIGMMQANS